MSKPLRCGLIAVAVILIASATACALSIETVMVAMRDGTKLSTSVALPAGDGPWPTILIRTPYGKPGMARHADAAVRNGYVSVVQDFRGRFDSEGDDYPIFVHDGWGENQDGYDTVEWVAAQKWSDGKVGAFGISGPGIALNMMAARYTNSRSICGPPRSYSARAIESA